MFGREERWPGERLVVKADEPDHYTNPDQSDHYTNTGEPDHNTNPVFHVKYQLRDQCLLYYLYHIPMCPDRPLSRMVIFGVNGAIYLPFLSNKL